MINESAIPKTVLRPSGSKRLVDDFPSGVKVPPLVQSYGIPRSSVYARLKKRGVKTDKNILHGERVDRAIELNQAGMTLAEAAATIGSNRTSVRFALEARDISHRAHGSQVRSNTRSSSVKRR